jgi:signal transduction histidine kinase
VFSSLRLSLALWYTAIVVVTFVVSSYVAMQILRRTLSDSLDDALRSELSFVVLELNRIHEAGATSEAMQAEIVNHTRYTAYKEYIEIYDSTGSVVYATKNVEHDTLRFYFRRDGPSMGVIDAPAFRGHGIRIAMERTPAGTAYVAIPTTGIESAMENILHIFLWLCPIMIVMALGGGIYLSSKPLAKVTEIIDAANHITADQLSERIPEHSSMDEIGRLISTFNSMIARLDNSFQQMKQFSADASHELRTPLAVMRAQLESALDNKVSEAEMKQIAANCLDEAMHMSTLVDNLLLLAKADANQEVIQKHEVRLGDLVGDIFDETVLLASQRQIEVHLGKNEDVRIAGDHRRLRQMFLNLIDNAIKYNYEHGSISLNLEKQKETAVFTIADTGIGIHESELGKIFDRFYRVDRARSKSLGGAGLGLSLVKWTVDAHGGEVNVQSVLNKGTTFTLIFPALSS